MLPVDWAESVVQCVDHYADEYPDKLAYSFAQDGESTSSTLTHAQLRNRALALAGVLRRSGLGGQAVVLLFPAGLDFIVAFLATSYAGAIAVPANLARNKAHLERLAHIVRDSQAMAILTTEALKASLQEGLLLTGVSLGHIQILTEVQKPQFESLDADGLGPPSGQSLASVDQPIQSGVHSGSEFLA